MRKLLFVAGSLLLAAALNPAVADAQVRPWQVTIAGGPSFTTGDFSDVAGTGYHVQGSVGFRVPMLPFGLRADLLWQELSQDDELLAVARQSNEDSDSDEYYRQIGGLLNATFALPVAGIQPYGLVGAGYISTDIPGVEDNESKIGFNAGLGLEFPFMGLSGVIETRYLNLLGGDEAKAFQSIPVSIGVRF